MRVLRRLPSTSRAVIIALAVPVIVMLACGIGAVVLGFLMVRYDMQRIDAGQRILLYQTDHLSLLHACRTLLEKRATFAEGHYAGDDPRLPKPIRQLRASCISVQSDRITIEMGGGFYRYGFNAYNKATRHDWEKPLVNGLCYYTENGRIPPPTRRYGGADSPPARHGTPALGP
jgi:hypothetical protein